MSDPIRSTGRRGFEFEKKGFQERNLVILLETLSKKETQKSIEALSKIDKDEWRAMAETTTMLKSFVSLGGTSELATTLTSSVKETIKLQIDSILSPLQNEINQAITDLITPFITNVFTPVINDLNAFLSDNKTGAGVGGIAGGVIGLFVGSPLVGSFIGAILGAVLEEFFISQINTLNLPPPVAPGGYGDYYDWLRDNPTGSYNDYLAWLAGNIGSGGGRGGGPQENF